MKDDVGAHASVDFLTSQNSNSRKIRGASAPDEVLTPLDNGYFLRNDANWAYYYIIWLACEGECDQRAGV